MPEFVKFQNRLQELVDELDCKRSELPKMIGIDYRPIFYALEYGIIPKVRVLIKIADYFNVSLPYLLGNSDDAYFDRAKTPSNFGTRVKSLCEQKKITFYRASVDCHLEKGTISRWIANRQIPVLETLDTLADYFGVSIDYLLGRTDDRN